MNVQPCQGNNANILFTTGLDSLGKFLLWGKHFRNLGNFSLDHFLLIRGNFQLNVGQKIEIDYLSKFLP